MATLCLTSTVACLQIIIVITGGELADGPTVEVPLSISQGVTSQQVRTFIYQLSDSTPGTPTPGVADLSSLACTLGGSYDEVPRDNILDDPLSTLRSFYSYVASLRFALDGQKPLWVPSYAAYTRVKVMSVVYPGKALGDSAPYPTPAVHRNGCKAFPAASVDLLLVYASTVSVCSVDLTRARMTVSLLSVLQRSTATS